MRVPVRTQILGLVSLLLVATMGAFLALAMRLTMRDKVAYVYEVNAAVAQAKADEVFSHLASLSTTIGYFVAAGECGAARGSAHTLLNSDPELLAVEIWRADRQGELRQDCRILDEPRLRKLGLSRDSLPTTRPDAALLAQLSQDAIAVRNESVPPTAALLTAVSRAPDGRVVVMRLKPDRLLRLFEERRAYQSWLVDGQGNVLAHPDAGAVVSRSNLLHVPIVQEALQGTVTRGVREYRDGEERYLGAWAHVGTGRLVVVTAVPQRMALSAVAELTWRTLLMAIAAVLAALLSAVYLARRLTRPLARLEAAVAALRAGELGVHVPVESGNELGRLAGAFNEMSRELKEREQRLKEAQARLLQADRLAVVGTLAAGVAHEINNPLTYIGTNLTCALASLRTLEKRLAGEAVLGEATTAVREATEGAQRVREIVADLRLFSRASDESRTPVDVREVLDGALKLVQAEVRRRASLEKNIEPELPRVFANRGRLGQVFLNLLVNAAQAIPDGRPGANCIRLTARKEGERVVVEISDTGAGIPAEIRGRIFDPFFTTKPVGEGTGLGLSIVHGIVTSIGGSIEVQSEPGHGTTFRVSLPVAASQEKPAERTALPDEGALRVLVVCTNEEMERFSRELVTHEVVRVMSTVDALSLLTGHHEPFDVVLCPVHAEPTSGPDLHRELRAFGLGHEERIVYVVGEDATAEEWEFLESVSNEWVECRASAAALEQALRRTLRLRANVAMTAASRR